MHLIDFVARISYRSCLTFAAFRHCRRDYVTHRR